MFIFYVPSGCFSPSLALFLPPFVCSGPLAPNNQMKYVPFVFWHTMANSKRRLLMVAAILFEAFDNITPL